MATWLGGIPADIERIELESVTLGGRPSAVVGAVFVLHRSDGPRVRVAVPLHPPVIYETFVADLARLNRRIAVSRG